MSSTSNSQNTAVLLLAHGSPESVDDIPDFVRYVVGGRPVPPQIVEEIKHRYSLIGCSPLNEITMRQGKALERELGLPVYVGMRNWKPFIPDVVKTMPADGVSRAIAICLAPQNSRTSVGLYRGAVMGESGTPFALEFIESWHDHPLLVRAFAEKLLTGWESACRQVGSKLPVIFTAHSVPQRTITEGDPYESQSRETAALVAKTAGLADEDWSFAFQSQGMSGGPVSGNAWIGPTVEDMILRWKEKGHIGVFIQPVGFKGFAANCGMQLWRAESLNDSPMLIAALADLTRSRLSQFLEKA